MDGGTVLRELNRNMRPQRFSGLSSTPFAPAFAIALGLLACGESSNNALPSAAGSSTSGSNKGGSTNTSATGSNHGGTTNTPTGIGGLAAIQGGNANGGSTIGAGGSSGGTSSEGFGGATSSGGFKAVGGSVTAGGSKTTGGSGTAGGSVAAGGSTSSGGTKATGGSGTAGGSKAIGGSLAVGGDASGGAGTGGTANGGAAAGGVPGNTSLENESADCEVAALPAGSALTAKSTKLPDPFTKIDGKRISTKAEWHCRRQEIRKQAEAYIYGEKPTPEVVSGTVTKTKISVHVEALGKKIDFSATIVLPSTGQGPFPAIINVGTQGGFGGLTLGESRILGLGVAVIYYNNAELGLEGTAEQSRGKPNTGKFYDIYGGNHSAGLLMAWAWGASRMLDVLQKSGGDIIDAGRLGVTGCSRNGKGAFAVGVLDDRIALTIPQETSTAGVPAYRIADVLGKERTDHNYNGLNWLSNNFEPFVFKNNVSNAVKLPIDTHALVGLIAPRGLLVLENPHQAQMGAPAGHTATVAGAEIYKALGVAKNVSYHSSVADTAHCSYKNEYTEILTQSIAAFLKHEGEAPGKIIVGAGGSLTMSDWKDWTAPTLQ